MREGKSLELLEPLVARVVHDEVLQVAHRDVDLLGREEGRRGDGCHCIELDAPTGEDAVVRREAGAGAGRRVGGRQLPVGGLGVGGPGGGEHALADVVPIFKLAEPSTRRYRGASVRHLAGTRIVRLLDELALLKAAEAVRLDQEHEGLGHGGGDGVLVVDADSLLVSLVTEAQEGVDAALVHGDARRAGGRQQWKHTAPGLLLGCRVCGNSIGQSIVAILEDVSFVSCTRHMQKLMPLEHVVCEFPSRP